MARMSTKRIPIGRPPQGFTAEALAAFRKLQQLEKGPCRCRDGNYDPCKRCRELGDQQYVVERALRLPPWQSIENPHIAVTYIPENWRPQGLDEAHALYRALEAACREPSPAV